MPGLFFEEFSLGRKFRHELTRTVSEADNTMFSLMSMNPQPLHVDAHFASSTEWGQRLFNSMFTLSIMVGLSVQDTTLGTTIGNLGMSEVRFPNPVFHGDTLRAETAVLSVRESKSRPDAGLVEFEHLCFRQDGTLVATCRRTALMRRKPVTGEA
ncbi:MaoC family dehydratase [Mesorhizobium sp. B4-1-4]|uniref:MaoC family dehydratase n=1 Tax=Mesorhizobium sp. B4-1-4 TaxID=2589888 RepID=UPI001127BD9F|nr:MaoC family dehydratase [Mesorhizobium sp. B4-1-4]UCI31963.1 MaoC family dehydratase [Mesorhizobium sp. B4-1-4]